MIEDPRPPDDREFEAAAWLFRPRTGDGQPCPAPELVAALNAGTLPAALSDAVAAHVSRCVVCRSLEQALEDPSVASITAEETDRIRDRVHAELQSARQRQVQRQLRRLTVAAAVVALLAVSGWMLTRFRASAPHSVFQLGEPPILPVAPSEQRDFTQALAAYQSQHFDQASGAFTAIVSRHRQSATGYFYLGVSELYQVHTQKAVTALEDAARLAANQPGIRDDVTWFLAVAYRLNGQSDQATARLTTLCGSRTAWSRPACAGLSELSRASQLHGTVTDADGKPVADVVVGEYRNRFEGDLAVSFRTSFAARTDAEGRYGVSGVPLSSLAQLFVRAAKPGYFTANGAVSNSADMQLDFRLYAWRPLNLGQVVHGTTANDPICDVGAEPCQRFALTLTASGTLEASVSTTDPRRMDLWIEAPNGDIYSPRVGVLQVAMPAVAGFTYQIRVLSLDKPRDFELTTRLR